jgi:hypothetical protein
VIDNTLDKYVRDNRVFACPADPRFRRGSGTSYMWNVALNGQALGGLNFMGWSISTAASAPRRHRKASILYLQNKVNILTPTVTRRRT